MTNDELVDLLVREGYLKTPRIIEAFRKVDRKLFVIYPEEAYQDHPLPIPGGQTISAPHMVAYMLERLEPKKTDIVLEIGAGSGYSAALLGILSRKVYSMEMNPQLAGFARRNLEKAGIGNVCVLEGDGSKGLPLRKYDKIIFTCAVPEIPQEAVRQLKDPGLLMAPVGNEVQELTILRKQKGIKKEKHGACVFVPLQKSHEKK